MLPLEDHLVFIRKYRPMEVSFCIMQIFSTRSDCANLKDIHFFHKLVSKWIGPPITKWETNSAATFCGQPQQASAHRLAVAGCRCQGQSCSQIKLPSLKYLHGIIISTSVYNILVLVLKHMNKKYRDYQTLVSDLYCKTVTEQNSLGSDSLNYIVITIFVNQCKPFCYLIIR